MTLRERFRAALLGEPVDRPAIWLREGLDFLNGPAEADHPSLGWQAEPHYRELWAFANEHCVQQAPWGPGGHFNRCLAIPPSYIQRERKPQPDGSVIVESWVDTPKGRVRAVDRRDPGLNTSWNIEPFAKDRRDLEKLLSVPFEIEPMNHESYRRAEERAGDRALPWTSVSSPCVVISGCMHLQGFLVLLATEKSFVHELLAEITQRWIALIHAMFRDGPVQTMVTMGGSEQITPPMIRPDAYDEYVVPYDGQIVKVLKEYVTGVSCHCHGKVRHALNAMLHMGMDSTDPVEPPPAGDVTIAEAREIVGDRMTLVGNFEFDELEAAEPDHIRRRVGEILAVGPERLVLAASAGPISRVTERLAANYRAWIEAVLDAA